jgi:TRAP-type transport system small permease protein
MVNAGTGGATSSPESISQIKKTGRTLESVLNFVCRYVNILGIAVLLAMTGMTVVDVIGRIFKRPIVGGTEITEFMMVTIVFLCIGWAAVKGKMITVDLVTMRLPLKVQAVLNVITMFIGLIVVVIITWRSFLATIDMQSDKVNTMILHIPAAPFMWILSFGFSILCLVMIAQFVRNVAKAVAK